MSANQNQRCQIHHILYWMSWTSRQIEDTPRKIQIWIFSDTRWWNHVTDQSYDLGSSSMLIEDYSVHAELKYYGHSKNAMHIVYDRNQAVATEHNIMPTEKLAIRYKDIKNRGLRSMDLSSVKLTCPRIVNTLIFSSDFCVYKDNRLSIHW